MKRGFVLAVSYEYLIHRYDCDPMKLTEVELTAKFENHIIHNMNLEEYRHLIQIQAFRMNMRDAVYFKIRTYSDKVPIDKSYWFDLPEGFEYPIRSDVGYKLLPGKRN